MYHMEMLKKKKLFNSSRYKIHARIESRKSVYSAVSVYHSLSYTVILQLYKKEGRGEYTDLQKKKKI
jgi:hypothetical protein